MIEIKKLNKYFWKWLWKVNIFSDLNLKLEKWDFISIIWPSWSWKSTFLNILSWIDRDFSWNIFIESQNISLLSDNDITSFRWKNISYIFQNFKLIDNLTVKENIDLIVEMNKLERNFDTEEILKIIWLESKKDSYIFNLSWWECQRVAIARAFIWKTNLLLADEPTWALDSKNKKIVMDLILKLHKKIKNTIILITHDDEVAKLANRVYKLKDENLIEIK